MNPISEQDVGALADAIRRRHRSTGASTETIDELERHAYRVASLVEDLAEGESLNALDYHVLRVAAVLHDASGSKARPGAVPEASAALGYEMLVAVGADPAFADAVVRAVRRHGGVESSGDETVDEPETLAEQLVHDACLLARLDEGRLGGARAIRAATARLYTGTAVKIAASILDAAEAGAIDLAPAPAPA